MFGLALPLLGTAAAQVSEPRGVQVSESVSARVACAEAALEALALENLELAEPAVTRLTTDDPADPLGRYLQGRLAGRAGRWQEAMRAYQLLLAAPGDQDVASWVQLAAGRLVRARQAVQEERVEAWLSAIEPPDPVPGRLLVPPPEPVFLRDPGEAALERMEATAVSIASWLIGSLAQVPDASALDLHVTHMVASLSAGRGVGAETVQARARDDRGAVPPLNTILGVSHRLARLRPQGPPPEDPGGEAPSHYYGGEPTGQWNQALAQALSHFQSENELPPTGTLDPATRQALEQAYRAGGSRPSLPRTEPQNRSSAMAAPAQEMGLLLGAEAVLSGTLEEEPTGQMRWHLVWVSPVDGSLLSPPLSGVLVPAQYEASWTQLIRQLLMYSPACQAAGACESVSIPPAPSAAGARAYGKAMLAVEQGRFGAAATWFRQAAQEGAGDRAAWYGMAWELDPAGLDRLERKLLTRIARGIPAVAAGSLAQTGRVLSGGLLQGSGADPAVGSWTAGAPLTYFPETGWLRISGHLEGR